MSSPPSISTEDRISTLPDTLICHILSFLPTKLAITTSVLSKRWTPLWQSLLTLNFDDECFADFASFRHFVYSVIISRDIKLPLQSFRIKCAKSNFDARDVNRFVHAAVQRGIQNLDINVLDNEESRETNETVPGLLRVLSCSTLVVLKLKYLTFDEVPQSVYLPLLKTLNLDSIDFIGHCVYFVNLLRGCPILEDFHTNNIELLQFWDDSEAESNGLPKLETESNGFPKLEAEFNGFAKLVRAKFSDPRQNFPLAWFRNATFLHLELDWIYEFQIPTFHNLTHMELIISNGSSYESGTWKWTWVTKLLQHCPKLQILTIQARFGPPSRDVNWNDPETVPECLSYQLRTCSLIGFYGIDCELQFVEYILLNSKLLRTMTIKRNYRIGGHENHQMLVKLLSYPRGSVMCRFLVY